MQPWLNVVTPFAHITPIAALVLLVGCASVRLPTVRDELVAMGDRDQAIRQRLVDSGNKDSTLIHIMVQIDSANTERLKNIVKVNGYLNRAQVGNNGLHAVFLIVQHSPDREFQQAYLPKLQELARQGDASGEQVALLTDRILVDQGKPQLYGTQLMTKDGKMIPFPIKEQEAVDSRRAEMGLMPLAEYLDIINKMYRTGEQ